MYDPTAAFASGDQLRLSVRDTAFAQGSKLRGETAGVFLAAAAARSFCSVCGVIGGRRPSGGSVIREVRLSQSLVMV